MKTLKLFLLCVFILPMVEGCKKYPDGPLISLRTKENRLVGHWDVESFFVDGNDSTAHLKSQPYYGTYKFRDGEYNVGDFTFLSHDNAYFLAGHWLFEDRKRKLRLTLQNASASSTPYRTEDVTWEIRRLKEKELWLKTNYNGKEYFVKFKQI